MFRRNISPPDRYLITQTFNTFQLTLIHDEIKTWNYEVSNQSFQNKNFFEYEGNELKKKKEEEYIRRYSIHRAVHAAWSHTRARVLFGENDKPTDRQI